MRYQSGRPGSMCRNIPEMYGGGFAASFEVVSTASISSSRRSEVDALGPRGLAVVCALAADATCQDASRMHWRAAWSSSARP